MQASQIPKHGGTPSYRPSEIQPQAHTHQVRRASQSSNPHWMQVKLRSLDKERRNGLLKKAKEVKYFYLDFLAAIKETSRAPAQAGSRSLLISCRINESMQFEGSAELSALRNSLALKLASLQEHKAKFEIKKMNPLLRLLCYPKRKLLDKKLRAYEGTVGDIIRITQRIKIAIKGAQTVSNGQNQN